MTYKIHVDDRHYSCVHYVSTDSLEKVDAPLTNPCEEKLLHNDLFDIKDNKIVIRHSTVRSASHLPAVLILSDGKMYGKYGSKILYKCIPDDKRLPMFLVPYEVKKSDFSKKKSDLYVTFKFEKWDDKHPIGILTNTIGIVNDLTNFYEYQLYCKSLNASIQGFTRAASAALKLRTKEEYINSILLKYNGIEDRRTYDIITIDAPGSQDFDDAIGFKKTENGCIISIYITNVFLWMETLKIWNAFSERISTIYLPDRKRPMLPTVLANCLCSLQENEDRFAFVLDIHITDGIIIKHEYNNALIKVSKNYNYNENDLLENDTYVALLNATQILSKKYRYLYRITKATEVVSYLMILMNYFTAKSLMQYKNGIYRSVLLTTNVSIPEDIPEKVYKYLKIWNSTCSSYGEYSDDLGHNILELDSYVHITSPIRRLVDLLNSIQMIRNHATFEVSSDCIKFYEYWIGRLEYINTTMRAIRRVQMDCTLLDLCNKNTGLLETTYDGYVFDGIIRSDGLHQYMVYLPDLKISSRITSYIELENYSKHQMKIYLFEDETNIKRKIRVQIV